MVQDTGFLDVVSGWDFNGDNISELIGRAPQFIGGGLRALAR